MEASRERMGFVQSPKGPGIKVPFYLGAIWQSDKVPTINHNLIGNYIYIARILLCFFFVGYDVIIVIFYFN